MLLTPPSLIEKKIYLRAPTTDDALNFYYWQLQSEPQSLSSHPFPIESPELYIEKFKKKEQGIYGQDFSIVKKDDNRLVGKVTFFNLNTHNRSTEIYVIIDPDERKKGYAKRAIRLLCNYLFKQRGLNRIYAHTAEFNEGAIKLLKSLHFEQEGVLRKHYFYNKEFHDGLIFSILS